MSIALDLKRLRCIRLALDRDNKDLLSLSKAIPMKLRNMSFGYDRGKDFFSFSESKYESCLVFCFVNSDDKPEGYGVVNKKTVYMGGEKKVVAYLSDLRALPGMNRQARKEWPEFLKIMIENYKTWKGLTDVDEFHCIILDGNKAAEAVLLGRRSLVSLDLLTSYNVQNIVMTPLMALNRSKFQFTKVDDVNTDEAYSFISQANRLKNMGCSEDLQSFKNRLKAEDYYYLKREGDVVASFKLSSSSNKRKIFVKEVSGKDRALSKLGSLMGSCLPLVKGGPIKSLYVDDVCFESSLSALEKESLLKEILKFIYSLKVHKNYHIISLFCPEVKALEMRGLFTSITHGKYYGVKPKGSSARSCYSESAYLNLDLSAS